MNTIARLRELFAYDEWANRETLTSMRAPGDAPAASVRVMAHVLAAERLWFHRLKQDGSPVTVWPEASLDAFASQIDELRRLWRDYLDGLRPGDLSLMVQYTNSKGELWANTVEDILTHVVMHSAYHRGQIAADTRASGLEPAYTDFIHAVRQRLIE
jgi:uncharacterized damage-inducible protein DinB